MATCGSGSWRVLAVKHSRGIAPRNSRRVKAGQQAQFISGLQSNLGKAFQLAQDQTFFNDPSHTFRVEYPRTQAVTAAACAAAFGSADMLIK